MEKLLRGVYAAVRTLLRGDGSLDEDAFRQTLGLLLERGIRGFASRASHG